MEKPFEYRPTYFLDLPDELVLHIVRDLHAIRSFEPQSQAFKKKEKEISRQCENSVRQKALYSLCLTSQRLKRIAEPILYSAFMSSSTWSGLTPLRLLFRTLAKHPELAHGVQYIENRLSDFMGNGLYDDLEFHGGVEMAKLYFDTLAAVIGLSPNLVHLSVVSLETCDVSLWQHLVQDRSLPPRLMRHDFPKLQTLCLQIHTEDYGLRMEPAWFKRISHALLRVPTLEQLHASGATSGAVSSIEEKYKSLQLIDLSECILDLEELIQLIFACTQLKHLGCHWAYLDSQGFHLPDLYAALYAHKGILEHLKLDTREVRLSINNFTLQPLGSLRDFVALKSVELCETSLFANTLSILDFSHQRLFARISQLLPPSLESLTILAKPKYGYNDGCRIDEAFALWDLAEDCSKILPKLRQVQIKSNFKLQTSHLTARFKDAGVNFVLTD